MSLAARLREGWGERDGLKTVLAVAGVIGLGILLGHQYVAPDKRVVAVAAAVVMFGVAWRLELVSALGVLAIAIPFPRYTTFGSTNLAFILLLLVVWLLRFTQREAPGPRRTPLDAPLAGIALAYLLSFTAVTDAYYLERGLQLSVTFVSCLLFFYLVVNNIRSEGDLRRFHLYQAAGIALIHAFCLWELVFPGTSLIPGYIDLRGINVKMILRSNYRVGGPWIDYELLSEFAALNIVFFLFMIAQSRSTTRKVLFGTLLTTSLIIMFSTVTRGGMAAFAVGLVYLLYLIRRRINFVPFVIIGVAATALVMGLSFVIREFTVSGDVFARFEETKFVGLMPESRSTIWPVAWARLLTRPLFGHGPYFTPVYGIETFYWPHCLPLFIGNCFGFLGLAMFGWAFWKFWRLSSPKTDRLDDPSYLKAFQIAAHVQLLIFFVDELKIEYLRNSNYVYQPWLLFATVTAGAMALRAQEASSPARADAPAPGRLASAAAGS